jgi:phenylacetate-CoA ligase
VTPDPSSPYYDPIETAPRSEIARVQQERLLEQVQHVYAHSPLIRSVWEAAGVNPQMINSVEEFCACVPFIDKDALRNYRDTHNDPFGGVLCCDIEDLTNIGSSSGTTGDPTLFADCQGRAGEWTMSPRDYWGLGLRPGEVVAESGIITRGLGRYSFTDLNVTSLLFDHDPAELERFAAWSLEYRPTFMFHLSTPIIYGLEMLEKVKKVDLRDVFSSYKACIFGGELLGDRAMGLIERWGVPLYQFSSLGDSGTIFECSAKEGFHAWEDLALVEVLDPEGDRHVAEGERGELVVTNLVDRVDPLIRYRSGDLVRYTREPCKCGRTHMRLWLAGRAGDEAVIGDKSVLPRDVWSAIESVEECSAGLFQIIRPQRVMSELQLRVGHFTISDPESVRKRVADAVEKATGLRPHVELVSNDELLKLGPPHKIPRVTKK